MYLEPAQRRSIDTGTDRCSEGAWEGGEGAARVGAGFDTPRKRRAQLSQPAYAAESPSLQGLSTPSPESDGARDQKQEVCLRMKETSQRWRGALYAVSEKDWSRVSINRGTKRTPYDKEAGSEILGTKCDRPGLLLGRAPGLRPTLRVSLIDLSGASDQPPRDLRLLTLGIPVTARGWRAHCELTATGSGPLRKGRDRKNGQPRRCLM